jgi:ribosomal protein L11 methyltransferase
MFSLELESDGETKDILIAELWDQGSTGIVEEDLPGGRSLVRAFFEDEADAVTLARRFSARIERHPARDWVAFSRANWEPLAVGARFYLVPEWLHDPAPPGRFRIEINPRLACGTGYHEATQLCLEALEEYLRPDMTVLDIGAGSGILSIAAALLGARRVVACDLDPVAVEISAENMRQTSHRPMLFTGSVDAIRSSSAGLIVANISADASIRLAPEILRCLAPGGRSIVSGFACSDAPAVAEAIERAGAIIERRIAKGEWCAFVIIPKP